MLSPVDLPLPPIELRELVGQTEPAGFDNASGEPVFGFPAGAYRHVLDFGCGCGRVARQLIQQAPAVQEYRGFDLHRGMVEWCQTHLTPAAPQYRFAHHDVANRGLNPGPEKPSTLPLPLSDGWASLVLAISVFTHLIEQQAVHYLTELARCLESRGSLHTTWFLFDKSDFPMMQEFQNALYINPDDPSNAVIYDWNWLLARTQERDLKLVRAAAPEIRGFHWWLTFAHVDDPRPAVDLPADTAPRGFRPPPLIR